VAEAVAAVDGVADVEVKLAWEPPWSQERMTEDIRLRLDVLSAQNR
jgi:metal-sulfur cluster biosynthetic enzyme